MAQIEGLKRELKGGLVGVRRTRSIGGRSEAEGEDLELTEMREQLNEAREKEVSGGRGGGGEAHT